jgi:hypothetical protein
VCAEALPWRKVCQFPAGLRETESFVFRSREPLAIFQNGCWERKTLKILVQYILLLFDSWNRCIINNQSHTMLDVIKYPWACWFIYVNFDSALANLFFCYSIILLLDNIAWLVALKKNIAWLVHMDVTCLQLFHRFLCQFILLKFKNILSLPSFDFALLCYNHPHRSV